MRISDWSSVVCSSDLQGPQHFAYSLGSTRGCPHHHQLFRAGIWAAQAHRRRGLRSRRGDLQARTRGCPDLFGDQSGILEPAVEYPARKSVVTGTSVTVSVTLSGIQIIKKKNNK